MNNRNFMMQTLLKMLLMVLVFSVHWSCDLFEGPEGPQGETGEMGISGSDGDNGDKGDKGVPGDDGTDGANGVQGPKGDKGETGNANVRQYNLPGFNFINTNILAPNTNREVIRTINMTSATFNNTIYLVYANNNNVWYHLPGMGPTSPYSVRHQFQSSQARITIRRIDGIGDNFSAIRVITLQTTPFNPTVTTPLPEVHSDFPLETTPGNRIQLPEIDYNNYEEVVEYFGLKD